MPNRTAHRGDTVIYRDAGGSTRSAIVYADQQPAPAAPGSSTSTTGGTIAAGTQSYRVSLVINGIETTASVAKTQVTTGATSTVTIDMTGKVPAVWTSFKVYGRTGGSELLMQTVNNPTLTWLDDGSVTPSGALPAVVTSVKLRVRGGGVPMSGVINKLTTWKGTTAGYWNR